MSGRGKGGKAKGKAKSSSHDCIVCISITSTPYHCEEFCFLKVFDWLSKNFSEDVCKNALCTACC